MHHWADCSLTFEFDPVTLDMIERRHERAGLFAWRETYESIKGWHSSRRDQAVSSALATMSCRRGLAL